MKKQLIRLILFGVPLLSIVGMSHYFLSRPTIVKNTTVVSTSSTQSQLRNQDSNNPIRKAQQEEYKDGGNGEFNQQRPQSNDNLSVQDYLALQAEERLRSDVTYDGSYHKIVYPMGDVPSHIGVCTDVVIRSFRGLGIDLQERVHEDMKQNFRQYPRKWNLSKPDTNIDHRRVLNLMTYFERKGDALAITEDAFDYVAGNIVTWDLGKGLYHIGIVSSYVSEITGNPLIVHNIGAGVEMNDILFKYPIIGHYQYGDLDSDPY